MADDETAPSGWPPPFTPFEAFDLHTIETICAPFETVNVQDLERALMQLALSPDAIESGRANGLRLLSGAASLVLRPSEKGEAWRARYASNTYRRPVLEDFSPDQARVLGELAGLVAHPGLKARLGDIAWSLDRKLGKAAKIAIDGYVEAARRLVEGAAKARHGIEQRASHEALDLYERAFYLARRTHKTGVWPGGLVEGFGQLWLTAREAGFAPLALKVARLGLHYELFDPAEAAKALEAVVAKNGSKTAAFANGDVLDAAADLHEQAGDQEAARRCRLAAVDQLLAMRGQVSSAGAEAHWVQTALFSLRHIPDTAELRKTLRRELRDLQEDSLGEFGSFSVPMDIGEDRDAFLRVFDPLDLPAALKQLAVISKPRPIARLRAQALQSLETAPISAMMSRVFSDQDGRNAAHAPGATSGEEPSEEWFKATINDQEGVYRRWILATRFEPARHSLVERFNIDERCFVPIVQASPFVRLEQVRLVSQGLARLIQGDYRSAVHLLTPQLEPGLRYILRQAGHDPSIEFDDMTEEDVGLPALLGRFRHQLETRLPPEVVLELELLFHHRPGTALRHSVAHGTLGAGGCFGDDAVYGCWLIYQLVCVPLLQDWDALVAPAIRSATE
ncbi:DUF7380 domain-containing protein [Caulobacter soli]|uniref:DUF7380 domain-containing protein n=1 Tax=Caulobacter soli TaxID=2708539 RepID=UPI0013EA6E71|nr:hypothetical protein [Caulobacter soli]